MIMVTKIRGIPTGFLVFKVIDGWQTRVFEFRPKWWYKFLVKVAL